MVVRRLGSNSGNAPGQHKLVLGIQEMAALEDLGPKTRHALTNAPLKIHAVSIVSQIIDVNDQIEAENHKRAAAGQPQRPYLDPKNPDLDARLANGVLQHNVELLSADRGIEEAIRGVRPLKARYNPKTERDQRKLRRVRF